MQTKPFFKNKRRAGITRQGRFALTIIMIFALGFPAAVQAAGSAEDKTVVIYYSRTGKSKVVCDTLKDYFKADMLPVRDLKDRSGITGYASAAFDSFFDRGTDIEPARPDLSGYSNIIIVSPIWNWKICVPLVTLMKNVSLENKKLLMFTTANIDIKKYEQFGDDAPFIKRFLRDYLREKSAEMRLIAASTGADIRGHCHIATKNMTPGQIAESTKGFVQKIQCALSLPACRPLKVVSR